MVHRDDPVASTTTGRLRGIWQQEVAVFRGVPYAAPPVGDHRFRPPQPAVPWRDVRDAREDGPIAPQLPSRLTALLGRFDRTQGEDCLSLTIWTPAPDAARRPVMVALHGGAWVSGAGSLAWYDGGTLAREGDIVVVGVNSRLGALGYLHCPGISRGDLGLLDQEAALAWVRDNIGGFGGNPDDVTLMGQSAGAFAVVSMLARPSRTLFMRAIVQSSAFRKELHAPDAAAALGRQFVALLGLDPASPGTAAAMRGIPVERLLEAQAELGRKTAQLAGIVGPFRPVHETADGAALYAAAAAGAVGRDILIGTTREEVSAFYMLDPQVRALDEAAAAAIVTAQTGDPAAYARYRALRPSGAPAELLSDAASDHTFRLGSLGFAAGAAAHGASTYVYQFDWAPPMSPFKACHCIELPFVFGTLDTWRDAPMLAGASAEAIAALSAVIRRCWLAFVRGGNPNHAGLPPWPIYDAKSRMTMRFDTVVGAVGDLAGYAWRTA
jgi:para-nitrobenzyl esterase